MPGILILLGLGALVLYMRQEPAPTPIRPGAAPPVGLPPGGAPPVNGGAGPPVDQVPPDTAMDLVIATQELGAFTQTLAGRVNEVIWWLAPIEQVTSTLGLQAYHDELIAMTDQVRNFLAATISRANPAELADAAEWFGMREAGRVSWPQTAAQLEALSALAGAPALTEAMAALVRDVAENGAPELQG